MKKKNMPIAPANGVMNDILSWPSSLGRLMVMPFDISFAGNLMGQSYVLIWGVGR